MTPNHGYTPTADRRGQQASPEQQAVGQQPQPIGQPQPAGQPQPTGQQPQPIGQPQPTGQPQMQQSPTPQPQQSSQRGTPQVQTVQQGQGTQQAPPSQPQQPQPVQQSQQQQGVGTQQIPATQRAQTTPSGQGQFGQPTGVQPQRQRPRQPLLKPIRVNEIITEDVVTAERDTPIRTVVAKMAEDGVGSVVVVEDDRPIGIITDRKVALALEELPDIAQRTAEELLHGDVFTADPSMSIFDAIQVMSDEGIRRLPIVDDNGALRGIVTLDDALVLLGGVVSEVAETVESQSPRL